MSVSVLLWHGGLEEGPLSGANDHFDWLIAHPGQDAERLTAFRVMVRIDDPACIQFAAERIADHRREYLTYEGPISEKRGWVRRVAEGAVREVTQTPTTLTVLIHFAAGWRQYDGRETAPATWEFEVKNL